MEDKNFSKHVLIGKIGKSVKLKGVSIATGDDAPIIFYAYVARMNPDYKFYFIGPNHLDKLTPEEYDKIFPYHNVVSIYANNREKGKEHTEHDFKPIVDYFRERNFKPDFMLFFNGMVSGNGNIEHFMMRKDGTGYKKLLMSYANYTAPYIYVMDQLEDVPVYIIAEDARYITVNAADLYNQPRLIFSQINGEFKSAKHITDWYNHTLVDGALIKAEYSHVEKICMMGLPDDWKEKPDIDRKLKSDPSKHFIVLSNGCGTNKINASGNNFNRYPEYKKWIIDGLKGTEYENTMIYGRWTDEIYEKEPRIKNIMIDDLQEEIADARYAFIYSQVPGFITIKPYEMIIMGLLPLIHPDYDKYKLLDIPEYLYVKDINDLINKMRELDRNPDLYLSLLKECQSLIRPEHIDGSFLNNLIFKRIAEDLGYEYKEKEGVNIKVNRRNPNMFGV